MESSSTVSRRDILKLGTTAAVTGAIGAAAAVSALARPWPRPASAAASSRSAITCSRCTSIRSRPSRSPHRMPLSYCMKPARQGEGGAGGGPGTAAHRGRPRGVVDAAERDDVRVQAPEGRALASEAAGERARAHRGGREVHVRAVPHGQGQSEPAGARAGRQGRGARSAHGAVRPEGAVRLVPRRPRLDLDVDRRQGGRREVRRPEEAGGRRRHRALDARALRAGHAHRLRAEPELLRARACPTSTASRCAIDTDPSAAFASFITGRYDFGPEYGQVVRRSDLEIALRRSRGCRRRTTSSCSAASRG